MRLGLKQNLKYKDLIQLPQLFLKKNEITHWLISRQLILLLFLKLFTFVTV